MLTKYNNYLDIIDSNIKNIIEQTNIPGVELLYKGAAHHFSKRGKMLRPLIMVLVNEDLDGDFERVQRFATSLELIHNYSLIHDDLPAMDNDDFRRGLPTVHKKFSEATAVLTGDFLLTKAFEYVTDTDKNIDTNYVKAINELAKNSNELGMLGGQFKDLNLEYLNSFENLYSMYQGKTSALFKSSFKIPAILLGKDQEFINSLDEIGRLFGLYFQIKDDLDDRREDDMIGKITIFKFLSLNEVKDLLDKLYQSLISNLDNLSLYKTKELIVNLYEKK